METLPHEGISPAGSDVNELGDGTGVGPAPSVVENPVRGTTGAGRRTGVWRGMIWLLFLVQAAVVCCHALFPPPHAGQEELLRTGLLGLAVAATWSWLTRVLPGQYVLLAGTVAILNSAVAMALMAGIGVSHHQQPASNRFDANLWFTPVLWLIVALNSRGVARFLLRGLRAHYYYGFWVIAASSLSSILFFYTWEAGFGLSSVRWLWRGADAPRQLLMSAAIWTLVAFTTAISVTPALLNKRPGEQPPPSAEPLLISGMLTLVAFLS